MEVPRWRLAVGLARGALVVSVAVLVLVWSNPRSTRRVEQDGEEQLEMLRGKRERLQFMREERHRPLELEAPSESNGHSESEQARRPFGLRRIFGF